MARASEKKTLFPQIVKQFLNNFRQRKIVETFNISSSTVHNIKRLRESGEISVRKGSSQKSVLDACEFRALRQHCIKNIHDSVMEITVWSQSATFPESFVREHSSLCHPQMQIKAPSCKEAIQHLLQQHSFVTEGAELACLQFRPFTN